jgi:hypothetical protein
VVTVLGAALLLTAAVAWFVALCAAVYSDTGGPCPMPMEEVDVRTRVVLVPPERSADLRAYFAKHTKTDRLDSRMLARLPLLHPEGLHEQHGLGPGDRLRRATKLHQTLTKRRSQCLARLDALLEILGPSWLGVFARLRLVEAIRREVGSA